MSDQKYFCCGYVKLSQAGPIIGCISFLMDAILATVNFIEVIGSIKNKEPTTVRMALFDGCLLTVYVGAAIQNLVICCAEAIYDLNKFFDTYNGVSVLFCFFAFLDGVLKLRDNTSLGLFFIACAILNVYFLKSTFDMKKELKRLQQTQIRNAEQSEITEAMSNAQITAEKDFARVCNETFVGVTVKK